MTLPDSQTVINTGNTAVSIINAAWPIVAGILAFFFGKWHEMNKKK